jgi:hypothetical protein
LNANVVVGGDVVPLFVTVILRRLPVFPFDTTHIVCSPSVKGAVADDYLLCNSGRVALWFIQHGYAVVFVSYIM